MLNFKDKVILITGGTGGIGTACLKGFLSSGASVFFTSSSCEKFDAMIASVYEMGYDEKSVGGCLCDMGDQNQIEKAVKKAIDKFQKIDVLVCNAGCNEDKLALGMKMSSWERVIRVNLDGNFKLIKEVMPHMIKCKSGRIISISSVVASMGNSGQANYAASKAGLEGMTRCLAIELARRNITVNAIAPGFIDTAMTQKIPDSYRERLLERIPVGYYGSPQDVFASVSFLASDAARYITGQTLHVNGGLYM